MIIRNFNATDIGPLQDIHAQHYKCEFPIDDFFQHSLGAFTVVEDGKVITALSIQTILEAVTLTDKSAPNRQKLEAFQMTLQAAAFFSAKSGYNQLHAFVQNDVWLKRLLRTGFRPTKGNALVLNF